MSTNLIRVGIVDDHSLFRRTLYNFLSQQPNLSVAVQAPDMRELIEKCSSTFCLDVLIMDVFLPGVSGVDAVHLIKNMMPGTRILAVSMSKDAELVGHLLEAGINGYVSKADEPEELLEAICTVAGNDVYRNQLFTEALYWNNQRKFAEAAADSRVSLTEREKKILQLLWQEKSNKEIADELFLGVRSVEKIRLELKDKIGAKSIIGMVKYAIDRRIVYPISAITHAAQNSKMPNGVV
ncbi:MAG TPA: response regulator transcription factor [Puia sp.]|nr:response regulator transcription factor [Puia sp.]